MTKQELIKKLEGLGDGEEVRFALFVESKQGYKWQLLNLNAQSKNDPDNVIGLVATPIRKDTLQEIGDAS